jgi:hypothetical protein
LFHCTPPLLLPPNPIAGEFKQEQLLLGSSYQVCECRAALQHLSSSSWFGAVLSSVLHSLLGVR